MKAIKKWIRQWLRDEQWVEDMDKQRQQVAHLAELLRKGMADDIDRVRMALDDELAHT